MGFATITNHFKNNVMLLFASHASSARVSSGSINNEGAQQIGLSDEAKDLIAISGSIIKSHSPSKQRKALQKLQGKWQHLNVKQQSGLNVLNNLAQALPKITNRSMQEEAFGRLRNSLDLDSPEQSPERLLSILSSLAGSIGSLQSDVDREQALIMVKKGLILLEKKPEEQLPILLGLSRQIWFLKEDHQNQVFDAIRSGLLLTQAKPALHVPILTELTDVMQIPRCRETASKLVENGLLQLKDDPVASSEIVQGLMITVSKNAA